MTTKTYCSIADITARKGQELLAKLTGDKAGQQVDQDRVTEAIEEFAGRMNNAIRRQYPDLPFDESNDYLNGLNLQGAYLLVKRDSPRGWTESDREEWKLLVSEIDRIADNKVDLRSDTEDELETLTDGFFSTNRGLFGRNKGLRSCW